jgi:hypothetical protein
VIRRGMAMLALAALGLAQTAAPPLATLSGTSVEVSGGTVAVDGGGKLGLASGARIALAGNKAILALERGGEIQLCGPARVSLSAGGAGALLLSLNQGAMEMRYPAAVADSLLTPGYRVTTIVPPGQLAAVSASVGLARNGSLCVTNRGSALLVENLWSGAQRFVINGETLAFAPSGAVTTPSSCPCAADLPKPVVTPNGPGTMFPSQPALIANAGPLPNGVVPPAPPPPHPHRPNFLVRFFHWLGF